MELRERKPETLKEKWRAHYHSRDFTPTEDHANNTAMCLFAFMLISLLTEAVFFLVPRVFPEAKLIVTLICAFIFAETLVNWHRSYYDVANWVTAETKEKYYPGEPETPQGWRNCIKCQVDAPPRSHHCNYCGKCILKRDQHCYFTGSCVGFYNQKFFWTFCLWSTVGLVFAMFLQLSYLHKDLHLLSADIITYIPPVTLHKWIMGYISFGHVLLIMHFYLSIASFLVSGFLFLWQSLLIVYGFTAHEAWKNIIAFQGNSTAENIRSVFGKIRNIPVLILIPYRFEHGSDGIQWTIRYKRVKGQ